MEIRYRIKLILVILFLFIINESMCAKQGNGNTSENNISQVAKVLKLDRIKFGDYIHDMKLSNSRGSTNNYPYPEVMELGKKFQGKNGKK
jgi:hypothetical protein